MIAFPRTVRRISENYFCLSLTGKLRELWSFAFLFKVLNSHSTSLHPVGVGSVANCQERLMTQLGGNFAMNQCLVPEGGGEGRGTPSRFILQKNHNSFFSSIAKPSKDDKRKKTKINENTKSITLCRDCRNIVIYYNEVLLTKAKKGNH